MSRPITSELSSATGSKSSPRILLSAQLEPEGIDDVGLFDSGLVDVELAGLAVVIAKTLGADTGLGALDRLLEAAKAPGRILPRAPPPRRSDHEFGS